VLNGKDGFTDEYGIGRVTGRKRALGKPCGLVTITRDSSHKKRAMEKSISVRRLRSLEARASRMTGD